MMQIVSVQSVTFEALQGVSISMIEPIGIMIVTGFLGSGKTTLLRHLLHNQEVSSSIAILVNEFGTIGLDEELIRSEHQTATLHIKQLSSGCICCTVRGNLAQALNELCNLSPRHPERILIETSGISRASELSYAINVLSQESPFYTDSIITVVDAKYAYRAYKESPSVFLDQLSYADVVLLNKQDLFSSEMEKQALLHWLKPLAPRATWIPTTQSVVSFPLLLGLDRPSHGEAPSPSRDLSNPPLHDFKQATLFIPGVISSEELEDWLFDWSERIFRIKGIVNVQDPRGRIFPMVIQAVGDRVDMKEISPSSPLWQTLRGLVFIGVDFSQEELQIDFAKRIKQNLNAPSNLLLPKI